MQHKLNGAQFFAALGLAVLLAIGVAGSSLAAAGDLDTTFSGDGKATVDFNGSDDTANGVAVQSDGKVVIVGSVFRTSSSDFAISRLLANGQNDASFGISGKTVLDIGINSNDSAYGVAIDANGKILVAGSSDGWFTVVRLNSDGLIDDTFGDSGISRFKAGINGNGAARAIAIRADGKIMVAGDDDNNFAVARLLTDGSTDNSFSGTGRRTDDFDGQVDKAYALAIVGNDTVVAGEASVDGFDDFALIRYDNDGERVSTFGVDGRVHTHLSDNGSQIYGLAAQPDGKVVAAGQTVGDTTDYDFALARYNTNGSLDNSFGSAGVVKTDFNNSTDMAHAIVRDPASGEFTVGGQTYVAANTTNDFALARYTSSGALKTSFGSGGKVTTDFGAGLFDSINALALAPGNKVVAAGISTDNMPGSGLAAAARYNTVTAPTPTPTGTACTISFSDVQSTDFFYEPVRYLYCAGAISGYGDNTFRPFANATRGQLAKIVVSALNLPTNTSGGPHFVDVPPTNPFYAQIETAYNKGIIAGYAIGNTGTYEFRYGNDVTRGQLAKIVVGAKGWTPDTTGAPHFIDVPNTNPFYAQIETAYNKGIIAGYTVNGNQLEFRWGNNATRGQIAKIVYGAVQAPAAAATK